MTDFNPYQATVKAHSESGKAEMRGPHLFAGLKVPMHAMSISFYGTIVMIVGFVIFIYLLATLGPPRREIKDNDTLVAYGASFIVIGVGAIANIVATVMYLWVPSAAKARWFLVGAIVFGGLSMALPFFIRGLEHEQPLAVLQWGVASLSCCFSLLYFYKVAMYACAPSLGRLAIVTMVTWVILSASMFGLSRSIESTVKTITVTTPKGLLQTKKVAPAIPKSYLIAFGAGLSCWLVMYLTTIYSLRNAIRRGIHQERDVMLSKQLGFEPDVT